MPALVQLRVPDPQYTWQAEKQISMGKKPLLIVFSPRTDSLIIDDSNVNGMKGILIHHATLSDTLLHDIHQNDITGVR